MRDAADGVANLVAPVFSGGAATPPSARNALAGRPLIAEAQAPFDLLDPQNAGTAAALLRAKRKKGAGSPATQIGEWESEGGSTTPIAEITRRLPVYEAP